MKRFVPAEEKLTEGRRRLEGLEEGGLREWLWKRERRGGMLRADSLRVVLALGSIGVCAGIMQPGVTGAMAHCSRTGALLRLRGGGGDDDAAQMAEIRARRAAQYAQHKSAESAAQKEAVAEEQSYVGAQKAWAVATDKLNAKTIQPKTPMTKGDARGFYLDVGVTLLRNRNNGMVLELVHGSTGWFQFLPREGAALHQLSAAGNVVPAERFYAAGLLDDIKGNPLKASLISSQGLKVGPWSLGVKDASLVVTHSTDPNREIHLLEEGFVYMNKSADEGIHIDSVGAPCYLPLAEAQTIVRSLA